MIDCLLIEEVSVLLLLSASVRAAVLYAGATGGSPELDEVLPVMRRVLKALTSIVALLAPCRSG